MFSCCRASAVKADIEIGTSCMFSVRRCAVTVISASASDPVSLPPAAGAAAAAAEVPLRIAATAYEIFEFIACPPRADRMRRDPLGTRARDRGGSVAGMLLVHAGLRLRCRADADVASH